MISAVVGLQYGDEGKGRYLDYLMQNYDISIRFNGGANAGHECSINGKKYSVHLVPTGVFRNKLSLVGNECVLDPIGFNDELKYLNSNGFDTKNIFIGSRVSIVCPFHKSMDAYFENNSTKIGTTKRGIGHAYADKMRRIGLRMEDGLLPINEIEKKYLNALQLNKSNMSQEDYQKNKSKQIIHDFIENLVSLSRKICDVTDFFHNAIKSNRNILFEGAQSTQLDLTWGEYPFVTSSSCLAQNAMLSVGYRFNFDKVYGVFKAYTTRVGTGPFITKMEKQFDEMTRNKGHEFGVTTGRPRICGWLDLVALKRSCLLNGITDLCIVKSDVLDDYKYVNACTGYIYNNQVLKRYPYTSEFEKIKPAYSTFLGWKNYKDKNLIKFLQFIESYTHVNIEFLSYSPNRQDVKNRNEWKKYAK